LAQCFEALLNECKAGTPGGLSVTERIQADLNLADYKVKFRQADHVKALTYGPLVISFATVALAAALAVSSHGEQRQREQEAKASAVFKILAAPPGDREQLLDFFGRAGLINLSPELQSKLRGLPLLKP
jgi:hypothetical protein